MDPILGQIILWTGNFVPVGWLACNGQILEVLQYQALYSIIGNMYGGNGSTNFALPDLRGRVPIGYGNAPGIGSFQIGQKEGAPNHTLGINEMSTHTHGAVLNPGTLSIDGIPYNHQSATTNTPGDKTCLGVGNTIGGDVPNIYNDDSYSGRIGGITGTVKGGSVTVGVAGANQPFSIMQPYTAMTYIIAVEGLYPQRP
jgi:microcystin-dependent protein